MPRPRTHDQALRANLLEEAGRTLVEQGPAALSLRKLAERTGTSTTAVYSLFGGKPELLRALFIEGARRFTVAMAAVEPGRNPLETIERLGVAYREYGIANPHLYQVVFGGAVPELEPDDEAREEAARAIAPLLDAVRAAREQGLFGEYPIEAIALALWSGVHGLVTLELNKSVPATLDIKANHRTVVAAAIRAWLA
ncbi:TetR/AcrR family transcriptional regulator [Sciscionella marina]|uniref:TetR/AcrR family transcriptional regulator n=1 Tax=Sciscionella marina TaxID=508770 RepID=UPI000365DEC5|nr:TetR/AcrR family transcriptional regulator [Sciscionella marina]